MEIGSLNVNGINAFGKNRVPGCKEFFDVHKPEILCLQEVKGDLNRLKASLGSYLDDYIPYVSTSDKAGYAGVAMLIKKGVFEKYIINKVELSDLIDDSDPLKPLFTMYGSGRILELITDKFRVVTVYTLNSGGKDDLRVKWDRLFKEWITAIKGDSDKPIFIIGDLNVVSTELDIWNDWDKVDTSIPGCKDYEISNFHRFLHDLDFVDTFRQLYPSLKKFSWVRPKVPISKGWRLDYVLTNRMDTVIDSGIDSYLACSDHRYINVILNDQYVI